jgi:hypothetical protein
MVQSELKRPGYSKGLVVILLFLLVMGLLTAPAWSAQSKITEPAPCSKDITKPTPIKGPTVPFKWSKDTSATKYLLLVGKSPGANDHCEGETTETSYTCQAIPTTSGKYVIAQLQVAPGGYNDNCIYITQ